MTNFAIQQAANQATQAILNQAARVRDTDLKAKIIQETLARIDPSLNNLVTAAVVVLQRQGVPMQEALTEALRIRMLRYYEAQAQRAQAGGLKGFVADVLHGVGLRGLARGLSGLGSLGTNGTQLTASGLMPMPAVLQTPTAPTTATSATSWMSSIGSMIGQAAQAAGSIYGMVQQSRDATAQRQAEQRQFEAEQAMQRLDLAARQAREAALIRLQEREIDAAAAARAAQATAVTAPVSVTPPMATTQIVMPPEEKFPTWGYVAIGAAVLAGAGAFVYASRE